MESKILGHEDADPAFDITGYRHRWLDSFQGLRSNWLSLLFIHPRAPNLIGLRSAGTMPA